MTFEQLDKSVVLSRFDEVLSRGLCMGVGERTGRMCIEAAICYALDLPHGDNPPCVATAVRQFKISLNDSANWKSPRSRAQHLRALGIAQLGSKGVVDNIAFSRVLGKKIIQILIPRLFREVHPGKWVELVDACEKVGTAKAARSLAAAADEVAAAAAAHAAAAAQAAADADAAAAAKAATAADAAAAHTAAAAKNNPEKYLILAADLALETLQQLGSPGCAWLK